jgi:hypothetical protein
MDARTVASAPVKVVRALLWPHWSSPTSARAIASRIAGVGRVTVSERRSIGAPRWFMS